MKYDFTSIIDRKGKDALAVDNLPNGFGIVDEVHVRDGLDCIPMWIADMNFATVPTVTEALIERAKHPTYGYFNIRDEYYDSIIKWHRDRKGVTDLTKEEIEKLLEDEELRKRIARFVTMSGEEFFDEVYTHLSPEELEEYLEENPSERKYMKLYE